MSGFRIWRLFATTLLVAAAMVMAGCMGLAGSNNNNGANPVSPTPSNPSPNPNPTPSPTPANPTASITVSPNSVQQGGTVTVTWQTQNANTVGLTQNGTSVRLDGNPLSSPGMQ